MRKNAFIIGGLFLLLLTSCAKEDLSEMDNQVIETMYFNPTTPSESQAEGPGKVSSDKEPNHNDISITEVITYVIKPNSGGD